MKSNIENLWELSHTFLSLERKHEEGRFLSFGDKYSVVIGNKIKEEIFKGDEDPINQQVQINGINFK